MSDDRLLTEFERELNRLASMHPELARNVIGALRELGYDIDEVSDTGEA